MHFRRITVLILIALAWLNAPVSGQTPPSSVQSQRVESAAPTSPSWTARARQIADLRAGSLDPSVDPDSLFKISLASPDALRAQFVANMVATLLPKQVSHLVLIEAFGLLTSDGEILDERVRTAVNEGSV